jgi:dTDP-4-amino-4,6-dideoxygalactose transaminase
MVVTDSATDIRHGVADRDASSPLAIKGGRPVVAPGDIVEQWPLVSEEDIAAVTATLRSGKLTWLNNETVPALEQAWAKYVGARHCIAFNSGTSALQAAVAAAGIEPGDEVLVPALTFMASAAAIVHQQGVPVFVDVDPRTFNLDPSLLAEKITDRTRAVMAVHLSGLTAPMDEILAIARPRGIKVIEDLSQAAGATYKGRKVGSIGDVGACSIMAGKNLPTAGEGGLLTTDDGEMRNRADQLKMFGKRISESGEREMNVHTMSYNFRFSSLLASFTLSQLERLDEYTARVQEGARYLAAGMAEIPGLLPPYVPEGCEHVYHHFRFRVDPQAAGIDLPVGRFRKALQDLMTAEGVALKQYQNRPVPGQWIFQEKRGCPWTCGHASRDVRYDINDYPQTLDIIRSSLLISGRLCMSSFFERRHLDLYLDAFRKVFRHRDEIVAYGRALDYREPWEEELRVS